MYHNLASLLSMDIYAVSKFLQFICDSMADFSRVISHVCNVSVGGGSRSGSKRICSCDVIIIILVVIGLFYGLPHRV